eukprot:755947-Hanusia_phi.AAC.2
MPSTCSLPVVENAVGDAELEDELPDVCIVPVQDRMNPHERRPSLSACTSSQQCRRKVGGVCSKLTRGELFHEMSMADKDTHERGMNQRRLA